MLWVTSKSKDAMTLVCGYSHKCHGVMSVVRASPAGLSAWFWRVKSVEENLAYAQENGFGSA